MTEAGSGNATRQSKIAKKQIVLNNWEVMRGPTKTEIDMTSENLPISLFYSDLHQ